VNSLTGGGDVGYVAPGATSASILIP
jgi:hypothetical protein